LNQTTGKHCILELFECPFDLLDDEAFIRRIASKAAVESGSTLLTLTSHKFSPQGVTALALLAESHLAIHTWPETGYAAVDVFTCGTHCDPIKACRILVEQLRAGRHSRTVLQRGLGMAPQTQAFARFRGQEDACTRINPPAPYG
jgi:S-adenosylmethionine decarboxylase